MVRAFVLLAEARSLRHGGANARVSARVRSDSFTSLSEDDIEYPEQTGTMLTVVVSLTFPVVDVQKQGCDVRSQLECKNELGGFAAMM